jgi:hypothetical protein
MKRAVFFFMLFNSFILSGRGQNAGDFEYQIEDAGITITGYKGGVKDIIIPEKINGLPVTAVLK